ncbi:hypothetical protein [Peptoniphilus sp. oral taxon 386]|uniref:hypothetical protein n=1 Tax=Peptoniphilus sp. oral taxon 386 TaxID=652713 RepID=UPI0002FCE5CC|nr:hypothetical protein [Peptoniphilus sp. oral taxon 386]
MNRVKLVLITLMLLILTGCSFINIDMNKVETPTISKTPISGKWIITKCVFKEDYGEVNFNYKDYIGKDVVFTNNSAIVGNLYSENVTFKAKKVNAANYLYKKFDINKKKLNIDSDNLYIVDIYDKYSLFYEIIKASEDVCYIYADEVFLKITKISDTISDDEFNEILKRGKDEFNRSESIESIKSSENGFLLGIKYTKDESSTKAFDYKTIFIKFKDNEIENSNEVDKILLPKQNKFFEISVDRQKNGDFYNDDVIVSSKFNNESFKINNEVVPSLKEIMFVSENYINYYETVEQYLNENRYSLYSLNILNNHNQIDLDDIVKDGEYLFKRAGMVSMNGNEMGFYDSSNIGFIRENGFWKLVGIIKFKDDSYKDKIFDLNILLPKDIVKYDKLSIPMSEIKEKFPNVKDAFISPNNRFLITMEIESLKVYNIINKEINPNVIYEIKIPKNSETIMTQWSMGKYSQMWDKEMSTEK